MYLLNVFVLGFICRVVLLWVLFFIWIFLELRFFLFLIGCEIEDILYLIKIVIVKNDYSIFKVIWFGKIVRNLNLKYFVYNCLVWIGLN